MSWESWRVSEREEEWDWVEERGRRLESWRGRVKKVERKNEEKKKVREEVEREKAKKSWE